jgi:transposase InsO family protein
MLTNTEAYPVSQVCEVMGLARSSYYLAKDQKEEQPLRQAIETIVREFPTYGSRRVAAQLQRAPYRLLVNRKRVQRLMRELGLTQKVRTKRRRTTNSEHPFPRYPNLVQDLTVMRPDQVWVSDITYVHLLQEFVYLAVIMDLFTRGIRGWQLGRSLDQELTLTALRRALQRGQPEIHHSDQGVQYAATAYTELLKEAGVAISMAEVGEAWQNGYAERLMRTIKEEEVDLSDYQDFAEVYEQIGHFIEEVYQKKRIHSALGYLTPVEFEAAWKQEHEGLVFSLRPG